MRRPTRLQAGVAAVVIVVLLAGVLVATRGDLWPERHTDGWGPLAAIPSGVVAFSGAGPVWSLGIFVCLARGGEPAVLDGTVKGTSRIGEGFEILGAVVRQGVPDRGFQAIASVDGYPPRAPYDDSKPARGFAVNTSCDSSDTSHPYTDLDLGLRRVSTHGGGWSGFEIGYSVGWRHHTLTIDGPIVVCGTDRLADVPADICSPG